MAAGPVSRGIRQSLPLLLALLVTNWHLGAAFLPVDNMNMDFMNDSSAEDDIQRMMLINSNDPKMRAQAMEAFKEIMQAKRLSTLQECRRVCVNEFEDATEFRSCNAECEATVKPGEYKELPTLGTMFKSEDKKEPEKQADQGKEDKKEPDQGKEDKKEPDQGKEDKKEPEKQTKSEEPEKADKPTGPGKTDL